MREELQQQLIEQFPKLITEELYIECGDGWYTLLRHMIQLIDNERSSRDIECHILQIKEKLGGLRFYMTGGNYLTDGVIALGENMSLHICEVCGNAGDTVQKGGWIKTRCKQHA